MEEKTSDSRRVWNVYGCLDDEAFLNLWKLASERAFSREEFAALPMPADADADEVWDAITLLRRWSGRDVGLNETRMSVFWVNMSGHARELVSDIVGRSGASSILGRYVQAVGFRRAFIEAKVDSLRSALAQDGLSLDYESVRSTLLGETPPHTAQERLVANYESIVADELARAEEGAGSRDIRGLFAQLACDVVDMRGIRWDMTVLANLDACMKSAAGESDEMMFCAARYLWGAGHDIFFVSELQATFASLLRKVYFIRAGRENLALLPLSSHFQSEDVPQGDQEACDISVSVEHMLQTMASLLDEMEVVAQARLERLDDMRVALDVSEAFSLRQKDVLAQAIADPGVSFSYDALAARFGVSYNTVRTDMSRLVAAGLLYTSFEGHRVLLRPVPGIAAALERALVAR